MPTPDYVISVGAWRTMPYINHEPIYCLYGNVTTDCPFIGAYCNTPRVCNGMREVWFGRCNKGRTAVRPYIACGPFALDFAERYRLQLL